ncbi:hypothetical protein [Ornithinibacillus halotolerans]|uniref:Uncharacterized protein n=1 Tax=Ornithinibacillus halotolerans TaxID=1274357 RepID=A0A916WD61_9BACI|nr:hypothetical protein [Ornithinibacillus halotolerans]GGA87299.1 hypothetical protein GCM10008025_32650 [Ornithinibacillus halotolerans]
MPYSVKLIRAVSILCSMLILIGTIFFLYGYFSMEYSVITGIGIGVIIGGVFIFIMGIFLVATEEIVDKNRRID